MTFIEVDMTFIEVDMTFMEVDMTFIEVDMTFIEVDMTFIEVDIRRRNGNIQNIILRNLSKMVNNVDIKKIIFFYRLCEHVI